MFITKKELNQAISESNKEYKEVLRQTAALLTDLKEALADNANGVCRKHTECSSMMAICSRTCEDQECSHRIDGQGKVLLKHRFAHLIGTMEVLSSDS